jgi:heme o synthase
MTELAHGLASARHVSRLRSADVLALAKPRITLTCVLAMLGGLFLARRVMAAPLPLPLVIWSVLGTGLIVAGANALNMYIEREIDARMIRTRSRPLPAGRVPPQIALWLGSAMSALAVPVLAVGVNSLTALLAVFANLGYVFLYTPWKQRSRHALLAGAAAGAMPPLLGWTAATGGIHVAGLVLFAVLFFWQVPHSLAIAIFRRDDYARAGFVVTPNVKGTRAAKHAIVRHALALVGANVLLSPLGVARGAYFTLALVLGGGFFAWCCWGLRVAPGAATQGWARSLFRASIAYIVLLLALLFGAVALDSV